MQNLSPELQPNAGSERQDGFFPAVQLDRLDTDPKLKTFCALPWMHLFISEMGEHYPCCVSTETGLANKDGSGKSLRVDHIEGLSGAWNSPYMLDIRTKMLKGEWPEICSHCHRQEDLGITSHRQIANQKFAPIAQTAVQQTRLDGSVDLKLYSADIRLGNQCNLRCRMCSPTASKGLVADWKQMYNMSEQEANRYLTCDWFEQPEFWNLFLHYCQDIRSLHFAGGEPFLIKQHFAFLRNLIDAQVAPRIALSYNTNLTILPPELLELWKSFERVQLIVSLDGLDEVNRYIRFPSNWEQIQTNIRFVHDNMATYRINSLVFNVTVQIYNAFNLPDLIDFLIEQYPRATFPNLVSLVSPPELSIQVMPASMKQEVTAQWTTYLETRKDIFLHRQNFSGSADRLARNITGLINFLNAKDESHLLPAFVHRTQIFDQSRNLNCINSIPALTPLFSG